MISRITQFINKLIRKPKTKILHKHQHNIRLSKISKPALKVVKDLQKKGFQAFLVGGCVRDLLIGVKPKDFDVATSATPEQVRSNLRHSFIIGRRFRLVHVVRGDETIEVSTFRAQAFKATTNNDKRIVFDNVYGSLEEDALRRDFTINSLYLDPTTQQIFDFAGGLNDIKKEQIRLIGSPEIRYQEDPVRMLRAVRFAAKLNFKIEAKTANAIVIIAPKLRAIPSARLFDEVTKILRSGYSLQVYELLSKYNLWQQMFARPAKHSDDLLKIALGELDKNNIKQELVFAALFWYWVHSYKENFVNNIPPINAISNATSYVTREQYKRVAINRDITITVRNILIMQERLKIRLKRNTKVINSPDFAIGLEFLKLRGQIDLEAKNLAIWWSDFVQADDGMRNNMLRELRAANPALGKKTRPRKRKPKKQVIEKIENTEQINSTT